MKTPEQHFDEMTNGIDVPHFTHFKEEICTLMQQYAMLYHIEMKATEVKNQERINKALGL